MCQFPEAFEFSERLLIFIAEHLFSARFGNFLFNNVKDRLAHNLHTKTRSIWSFILHQDNRRQFLHPIYDKNSHLLTLVPNTSVIRMTFWIRLYNKANPRYSNHCLKRVKPIFKYTKGSTARMGAKNATKKRKSSGKE